ncbi:hypothetical protein [Zavarzinella formosa]|uniref:hypothetical protein n=1 Tax=Zavarzinella formosa TaxID=360055 RepID=UPI0002F134F5|nr:hypothetical protein [Zavarzinella formosa]
MAKKRTADEAHQTEPAEQHTEARTETTPAENPAPTIIESIAAATAERTDERSHAETHKKPGRGWTERYVEPVRYRMFTAKDGTGKEQIMFKFNLPAGQTKPDDAVVQVMRDHKKTEEGYSTGLRFEQDAVQGPVWKLPSTPAGRSAAMAIDEALNEVAHKMEAAARTPG